MKDYYKILFSFLFILVSFLGCTTNVVNLQEVDLIGPSIKNQIKIVEDKKRGDIDINLNLSINNNKKFSGKIDGHSKVNVNNVYEIEEVSREDYYLEYADKNIYDYEGMNYSWITPSLTGSIDLDLTISNNFAFTIGTKLSSYEEENFFGFNTGVGFFQRGEELAYRFDTFFRFQENLYDITYVKAEDIKLFADATRKVYLYNKRKKENFYNLGFMFSLNSAIKNWPVNIFANYSFGWQTFYDISTKSFYQDEKIGDFEHDEYYHSFSIGLYQRPFETGRIMIGYNLSTYGHSSQDFIVPSVFVQYDFRIF